MIGDDQTVFGNKRTGTAVDATNTIDQAIAIGIEDLIRRDLQPLFHQTQTGEFADRIHSFMRLQQMDRQKYRYHQQKDQGGQKGLNSFHQ